MNLNDRSSHRFYETIVYERRTRGLRSQLLKLLPLSRSKCARLSGFDLATLLKALRRERLQGSQVVYADGTLSLRFVFHPISTYRS